MKEMGKKLRSRRGMSLTELLVAILILSLVTLAMAAGIRAATETCRKSTMVSDAQMLSSTLSIALMDELRFAEDVTGADPVVFTSRNFGEGVSVGVNAEGRVTVGGQLLLPDSVYGTLKASAEVKQDGGAVKAELTIWNQQDEKVHTVSFSVVPLNE